MLTTVDESMVTEFVYWHRRYQTSCHKVCNFSVIVFWFGMDLVPSELPFSSSVVSKICRGCPYGTPLIWVFRGLELVLDWYDDCRVECETLLENNDLSGIRELSVTRDSTSEIEGFKFKDISLVKWPWLWWTNIGFNSFKESDSEWSESGAEAGAEGGSWPPSGFCSFARNLFIFPGLMLTFRLSLQSRIALV